MFQQTWVPGSKYGRENMRGNSKVLCVGKRNGLHWFDKMGRTLGIYIQMRCSYYRGLVATNFVERKRKRENSERMRNLEHTPEKKSIHQSEREIHPPPQKPPLPTAANIKFIFLHTSIFEGTYRLHRPHLNFPSTTAS
jgi:hypothetical protein